MHVNGSLYFYILPCCYSNMHVIFFRGSFFRGITRSKEDPIEDSLDDSLENSPDKKTRVGSLHNPREYDGRLPPDAGYYLNLVIPRKEEPRKKIGSRVRLLHGRILQIKRSIYKPANPRILVNLLVKLTRMNPRFRGHGGSPSRSPVPKGTS